MNKNCVYYKGIYLDPNSKGYELYIKKEFKELDALIKLLDVEFRRFIGRILHCHCRGSEIETRIGRH